LRYRLNKWVDQVEDFNGAQWGGNGSMTEEQKAVFDEVRERARNLPKPVDIIVTEF
jgi:hypothetical protein